MTVSTIDWDFWRTMQQVKVWQAVALSLGLDPDRMDQSRDYWKSSLAERDVPSASVREEFSQRLRLIVASLADPSLFTKELTSSDTPANHRVQSRQVAAWLGSIGRQPLSEIFLSFGIQSEHMSAEQPALSPQGATSADTAFNDEVPPHEPPPLTELQKTHAWQEEQVRRATRALGFDPLALPPNHPQRGFIVKSVIRTRCEKNHPIKMRAAIFDKAWERMLSHSPTKLKYAE